MVPNCPCSSYLMHAIPAGRHCSGWRLSCCWELAAMQRGWPPRGDRGDMAEATTAAATPALAVRGQPCTSPASVAAGVAVSCKALLGFICVGGAAWHLKCRRTCPGCSLGAAQGGGERVTGQWRTTGACNAAAPGPLWHYHATPARDLGCVSSGELHLSSVLRLFHSACKTRFSLTQVTEERGGKIR